MTSSDCLHLHLISYFCILSDTLPLNFIIAACYKIGKDFNVIGDVMAAVGLRKSMAIAVFKGNMTFVCLSDPHPQQIHNIYHSIVKQECRSNQRDK